VQTAEIRPIERSEAESFLRLLCEVFDLDVGRARDIFFQEPMFDLNRKWALFENGAMVSILTTTPLRFGWGRAIGISGVATRSDLRGAGHAGRLLERVLEHARRSDEGAAILFARDTKLYERVGFEFLDYVVRGPVDVAPPEAVSEPMPHEKVRGLYERWSEADPARLRRDDRRWSYWRWHYRLCTPCGGGYVCTEGGVMREAVLSSPCEKLPLPRGTEWLGLASMAESAGIPVGRASNELMLLGWNVPACPQMFMTDQF
jgi:GNAT superfamily N-acetyltransferase